MKKHKLRKFEKIAEAHLADEARIHKDLFAGRRTLKQHYRDTLQIHKKAYKKLKKLLNE